MTDLSIPERAARLMQTSTVCDMTLPWRDFGRRWFKDAALPRFHDAGFDFVSLTISGDDQTVESTILQIAREHARIKAASDRYLLVEHVDDIERARESGRLALGFHFQGTDPFLRDTALVETYYRLGVRHALLAYNQRNAVGTGCHEKTDGGLSQFGAELIREMNRIGMIVDLSHTGYRTVMDALEVCDEIPIFSHSNPRALVDHPRNITDEMIRACAERGGVIGINGIGAFLGDTDAKTGALVDHIDYVVQLVGARHVGIGLDYVYDLEALQAESRTNPGRYPPEGGYTDVEMHVARPEQIPEVTEALLGRGYGEDDVAAILGGNWLRVMRAVWK